ncbi:MAG: hypothetical protein FJ128_04020 [Deltaproteobacteria bacterium]|nr:hypothetical protein [Deltaproteobacteria bacterium]
MRNKQSQNQYLTEDELLTVRNPDELYSWVHRKLVDLSKIKGAKEEVLLRKGLFKQFFYEVKPLAFFAKQVYRNRPDITIRYLLGNQGCDAIIDDSSQSPLSTTFVELTYAIEGHDHSLRMEYFLKNGDVSLYSPIKHYGNKGKKREIKIECELVEQNSHLKTTFELIKKCAEKKSNVVYGKKSYILIIVFDDIDWQNAPQGCTEKLKAFVKFEILPLRLDFKELYLIGSNEIVFLHFPLIKG